jgi:hypothetical protein
MRNLLIMVGFLIPLPIVAQDIEAHTVTEETIEIQSPMQIEFSLGGDR